MSSEVKVRLSKMSVGKNEEQVLAIQASYVRQQKEATDLGLPDSEVKRIAEVIVALAKDIGIIRHRMVKTADGVTIEKGAMVWSYRIPVMGLSEPGAGTLVPLPAKYSDHFVTDSKVSPSGSHYISFAVAETGKQNDNWSIASAYYSTKEAAQLACLRQMQFSHEEALAKVASFGTLFATMKDEQALAVTVAQKAKEAQEAKEAPAAAAAAAAVPEAPVSEAPVSVTVAEKVVTSTPSRKNRAA